MKKIFKGALAIIVTSAVVFPATNVFADETTSEPPIIDLEADSRSSDKEQTPLLLPGDFFYFSKLLLEKIHLALTFDDIKETKLMAEYAGERLAEAEALFTEGNEEEAVETMKKAIDHIDKAEEHVTNVEEEASEEIVVDELNENKGCSFTKYYRSYCCNGKGEKSVAKAALQRNIEKSYAKLAKKMEKREKKQQQKNSEFQNEESAAPSELDPSMETTSPKRDEEITPEVSSQVTTQPAMKEIQQTAVQEKKSAKQELQQQRIEAREAVKEKKEEMKQAAKEWKQHSKRNNDKGN
ncbi:DUF5667 domain-containing protein [Neobacillus niacini]|uniref:DUF5667 domain-containing protein n=1 Tax=Neobacillus niacini TaxID=86668 RepID=UPI002DB94716|nr:DUF5667 domain-containing protein [Neobacillus niacini]